MPSTRCGRSCRRSTTSPGNGLSAEHSVTYPTDAEDQSGHEIVFSDGFPSAFSGRAKLVPAAVLPRVKSPIPNIR